MRKERGCIPLLISYYTWFCPTSCVFQGIIFIVHLSSFPFPFSLAQILNWIFTYWTNGILLELKEEENVGQKTMSSTT